MRWWSESLFLTRKQGEGQTVPLFRCKKVPLWLLLLFRKNKRLSEREKNTGRVFVRVLSPKALRVLFWCHYWMQGFSSPLLLWMPMRLLFQLIFRLRLKLRILLLLRMNIWIQGIFILYTIKTRVYDPWPEMSPELWFSAWRSVFSRAVWNPCFQSVYPTQECTGASTKWKGWKFLHIWWSCTFTRELRII